MVFEDNRVFNRAIEKMRAAGEKEIYIYTIPPGFRNNKELLAYWYERGYQAEIIDTYDRFGILHVSW